jgi:O-acetylhomoserine/O-acetylserine sulfhydrylase-like pyridoxal-dependent enzyme
MAVLKLKISELINKGLANHSSHSLSKKYLKKGCGALIAFILKNESEPSISKLKLVSQGKR